MSIKFFRENGHFAEVNRLLDPERLKKSSKKDKYYIKEEFWGKINWNLD